MKKNNLSSLKKDSLSLALIIFLIAIVFRSYFTGEHSPTWDFLGAYLTNAIAWWDSGSFFNPPHYLPYVFSGYPAQSLAQSSGWYLPYWALSEIGILSSYPIAILQVFTILFGVMGFYFLMKKFKLQASISLIIAVGYLFSPGFFSNASHVDIVRSWSFLPWLFLILTPWTNYNFKKIILAAVFIFQFLISVYPGTLIASFYIFSIYIILVIWYLRPDIKNYLIFQIGPIFAGLLMSLLKWIPLLFEERIDRGGNSVVVNQGIIATLIYPYETEVLSNDLTMRSFFIAPLIILSTLLISKLSKEVKIFIIIGLSAIALGIDFPLTEPWQEYLPLLNQSRFRTTDFKPFIVMMILALGGIGLQQALKNKISIVKLGVVGVLGFGYLQMLNFLAKSANLPSFLLADGNRFARISGISLVMVLILIWLANWIKSKSIEKIILTTYFIVTLGIGWMWAFQTPAVWLQDRIQQETLYFGDEVKNILSETKDYEPSLRQERAARDFPLPYPSEFTIQMWNRAELNKSFASGGLVSLKGIKRYEQFIDLAISESGENYHNLIREPITAWLTDSGQANLETANCIANSTCLVENFEYEIVNWEEDRFTINLSSTQSGLLVINEIPWKGWHAEICESSGCSKEKVSYDISKLFVATSITDQTNSVTFQFEQPFRLSSWIGFWLGNLLVIALLYTLRSKRFQISM